MNKNLAIFSRYPGRLKWGYVKDEETANVLEENEKLYKKYSNFIQRIKHWRECYSIIPRYIHSPDYKRRTGYITEQRFSWSNSSKKKMLQEHKKEQDEYYSQAAHYYAANLKSKKTIDALWDKYFDNILINILKTEEVDPAFCFIKELSNSSDKYALNLIKVLKKRGFNNWENEIRKYLTIILNSHRNIQPKYKPKKCFFCKKRYFSFKSRHDYWGLCRICGQFAFESYFLKVKTKEEMLSDLKRLCVALGFIPPITYSSNNAEFINEVMKRPALQRIEILHSLTEIMPYEAYRWVFKNWFTALVKSQVLPEETRRTPRGTVCLSKDKHLCLSLAEKRIDDWLFHNKIRHNKEPVYPKDAQLNPNGVLRADWKVGDAFIEFFGLKGSHEYDKKIYIKKQLCKKHNLQLIEIYNQDISQLEDKLYIIKALSK